MNSRKGSTAFTKIIALMSLLVFLVLFFSEAEVILRVIDLYGLVPIRVMGDYNWLSLLSYMFLHADLDHLLTNLIVLYGVGREVESSIGSLKFGSVFLVSGVLSGYTHALFNPGSELAVIGMSGALFGTIAVMVLLMPFKLTTTFLIPIPGVVLGLVLLVMEVANILSRSSVGIAHDIHLYGFFLGGLSAFVIDYDKALRGLIIAVAFIVMIYLLATYGELIPL